MTTPHILIVGAGIGGLSAAAILSRTARVSLFEKNPQPGGKARNIDVDDVAIASGPTVLTLRDVLDDVFNRAGGLLDNAVSLTPLTVLARHFWRDGSRLDLFHDEKKSQQAIAAFAGAQEARRYAQFCARARTVYDTLAPSFIERSEPSFGSMVLKTSPKALLGLNPYISLWRSLGKQFSDQRLQQLFARYATYCGSSPFDAPSTLMLIAHVEQQGVWSVEGGIVRIAEALAAQARANGAELNFDQPVDEIEVRHDRACGVSLADGTVVEADAILFNGDVLALSNGLMGAAAKAGVDLPNPYRKSLSALTFSMVATVDGRPLHEHNIFFNDTYRDEFTAIFHKQNLPETPTVYIHAPDYSIAGPQPLFLITNAPPNGDDHLYTEEEIQQCLTRTLNQLRSCGLSLQVRAVEVTPPSAFARMFPGTGGAIYGMASHGWRASFQRMGVRSRLSGLYLAGGSVHPGSGVPMAAMSGRAAAQTIMKDLASAQAKALIA